MFLKLKEEMFLINNNKKNKGRFESLKTFE